MTDTDLLREIRDDQRALLEAYREASARSLAVQDEAVQRQAQMQTLYRRVVAVVGVVGLGLVVYVLVLIARLTSMLG